jgi:dTDP-4-dehydrorhamnose 3,5-epimerase
MKIEPTSLKEVLLISPDIRGDRRGYFLELWRHERFSELGLNVAFVQDNLSYSQRGTLRGLHFQNPEPQGKLVTVLVGEVFDVAVDIRKDSPTFMRWAGVTLNGETKQQLYIPPGFAHGFVVTSESALFHYKCTTPYRPAAERAIRWDDPAIGIAWPVANPVISERDDKAPRLADADPEWLIFPPKQ